MKPEGAVEALLEMHLGLALLAPHPKLFELRLPSTIDIIGATTKNWRRKNAPRLAGQVGWVVLMLPKSRWCGCVRGVGSLREEGDVLGEFESEPYRLSCSVVPQFRNN